MPEGKYAPSAAPVNGAENGVSKRFSDPNIYNTKGTPAERASSSAAEEEPPPPGGLGSAGRSASYDETLDDPATVLARAEAALARARAARDDGADA